MADPNGTERRLVWLVGLILTVGSLACYWPVHQFQFVNLDDSLYLYQAPMVGRGLSWPGVVWAFHSVRGGNWNPLVWLSHMVDCQLYGLTPGGHHVTNLALHTANVLLLFLLLRKMTGTLWRSAFVAAVFAWHPLHVESVAWVSERKDVLSALFWMLTLWAYCKYVSGAKCQVLGEESLKAKVQSLKSGAGNSAIRNRQPAIWYVLALVFFALGLMSKPMLVTLPFVLLLLDYWPLNRNADCGLRIAESGTGQGKFAPVGWGRLLLEKVPFGVLSLGASGLAIWAQNHVQALGAVSLSLRLENVAVSYVAYLAKHLWPVNLAVFYPYPASIPAWQAAAAALFLGAISWAVIWQWKRQPYLAVGWFWFVGTLVPVIGLVQVGMQAMADRYTYIPTIGLGIMVSWGVADLLQGWVLRRVGVGCAAALALAGCLALTRSQLPYWRNSTALYEHALRVTSGNYLAHDDLGCELMDQGKLDAAAEHFQEVIRLMPTIGKPYNDLGKVRALQGQVDQALLLFSNAVRLNPGLAQARWNLGNSYLLKGNVEQGLAHMRAVVELNLEDSKAHQKFADELLKHGRAAEALPYCERVVREQPTDAHAHFMLGMAYLSTRQPEQAAASFQEALRLAPRTPECLNALAWMYATSPRAYLRQGAEAVRLAEAACQLTQRHNPVMLDTLAAAYAEAGRFEDALKVTEDIRALALASKDSEAADTAMKRLELYKAGKAYRDE